MKIFAGEVLPSQLVSMTPTQLATAEQQEQYAKMHVSLWRQSWVVGPRAGEHYSVNDMCARGTSGVLWQQAEHGALKDSERASRIPGGGGGGWLSEHVLCKSLHQDASHVLHSWCFGYLGRRGGSPGKRPFRLV